MSFKNKTVLITGASRGIGKALALAFAKEGADLALTYNTNKKEMDIVDKEIRKMGCKTLVVQADIRDIKQVENTIAKVKGGFGRLDVLINNAAVYKDSVVWKMEKEIWDEIIETDLSSVFYCTKYAVPLMREQNFGRIITISSVVGQTGGFGVSNYAAAKAGIFGFTKTVSREVANKDITVNSVVLGYIETGMLLRLPKEVQDKILAEIPMKRWGKTAEVAATVLFIASEGAGYITGQEINVNGGYYMG